MLAVEVVVADVVEAAVVVADVAVVGFVAALLLEPVTGVPVELAAGVLVAPLRPTVPATVDVPVEAVPEAVLVDADVLAVSPPLDPHPARDARLLVMRTVTQIRLLTEDRLSLFSRCEEPG